MDEISESRLKTDSVSAIDAVIAEKRRAQESERHSREVAERLAKLDDDCVRIARQAADFTLAYGRDDMRTEMMMELLGMLLDMKDSMKLFTATSSVMSVIGDVTALVDDIMNFNSGVLDSSLQKKYGFFARMREKRRIRRAMQNNRARMKSMYDMILAQQEFAYGMTDSMGAAAAEMRIRRERIKAKREKLNEKRKKRGAGMLRFGSEGEAAALVERILSEKAGGSSGGNAAVPDTAAPSPSSSGGGKSDDVPDISDII